ncbi:MAG: type II secretion system GspH family protein [Clostridia bacterium]|nr:type II secretion system GspH family protein [Clostridia bacterium]MDY3784242.1 type II secretion system protein [Eubacteriales bacterium]
MKKLNNKKGFTIVELVIVIAVIGILAAVLIPTFSGVVESANESNALSEASNSLKVILAERAENGEVLGDAMFLYVKDSKVVYTIEYKNNQLGTVKKSTNVKYTISADTLAYAKAEETIVDVLFTNSENKTITKQVITDISKNIIILVEGSAETVDTEPTQP